MRSILLLLATTAILGSILVSPVVSPGSESSGSHVVPFSSSAIQQTSTLAQTKGFTQKFWQNGSNAYQTGSTKLSIPFDAGGLSGIVVESPSLSVTYTSFSGSIVPRNNITQGTAFLANATNYYSLTVFPSVSTTPVSVSIPAAYTQAGGVPSATLYTGTGYDQTSVVYYNSSTPVYSIAGGTTYTLSYSVPVPAGYTVNLTTVYFPWPSGTSAGASSLNVSVGSGYAYANATQIVAGGFFLSIPSGLSTTTKIVVRVLATPISSVYTQIPIGKPYLDGNPNAQYQANASWINQQPIPYGGGFLITSNFSYPIDPIGVNVTYNGHYLKNGTFVLAGTVLEILPGSLIVGAQSPASFSIKFYFLNAPPQLSIALGDTLIGVVSIGDFLIGAIVALLVAVIVGFVTVKRSALTWTINKQNSLWWGCVYGLFFFGAIYVLIYLSGVIHPT
jgi:hypothetical protein